MPFPDEERRFLLQHPGIGPAVLARLEDAGYTSLAEIGHSGVSRVVETVIARVGSRAWCNRRGPLERALHAWTRAAGP